jgi:hypothetical protein
MNLSMPHSRFVNSSLYSLDRRLTVSRLFFVHGLGGHAFSTWAYSAKDSDKCTMWPRDFLPTTVKNRGWRGRYSIIGYDAAILGSSSITSAAQQLLALLIAERSQVGAGMNPFDVD